ncbi:hypothetical protein A2U01_0091211, partial [Trifolium medium]|nr:hypothetical protein [Trifolium medium]
MRSREKQEQERRVLGQREKRRARERGRREGLENSLNP